MEAIQASMWHSQAHPKCTRLFIKNVSMAYQVTTTPAWGSRTTVKPTNLARILSSPLETSLHSQF